MSTVYLDANNDLLAIAKANHSVPVMEQNKTNLGAASALPNIPDSLGLIHREKGEIFGEPFHRYKGTGDGTSAGDWETVEPDAWSQYLRIGRYMTPANSMLQTPDFDFDFRLSSPKLHKEMSVRDSSGFVTQWNWIEINADGSPGDVVVRENHTYTVPNIAPVKREEVIEYLRNDGTPHADTKVRTKWYRNAPSIAKEGQKRRGGILDEVRGTIFGWLLANGYTFAEGQNFVASLGTSVELYKDSANPAILTEISNASNVTFDWLDNPNGFSESLATPVRNNSSLSTTMVSPRSYMLGTLNIYA